MDKIQELTRILDATLATVNPPGLHNGTNSMKIFDFILHFPGMEKFIGTEAFNLVSDQVTSAIGKDNCRQHTKQIWMYPNYKYDPWMDVDIDELENVHSKLEQYKFMLKIVDGKIFLTLCNKDSFNKVIYDLVADNLGDDIVVNSEGSHITVVNSNIVYDIGLDEITSFLKDYENDVVHVKFGKIKSTISRDWSIFSKCYVIEIFCDYLTTFIENFNKKFNKAIRISPHITFAVKNRSLW